MVTVLPCLRSITYIKVSMTKISCHQWWQHWNINGSLILHYEKDHSNCSSMDIIMKGRKQGNCDLATVTRVIHHIFPHSLWHQYLWWQTRRTCDANSLHWTPTSFQMAHWPTVSLRFLPFNQCHFICNPPFFFCVCDRLAEQSSTSKACMTEMIRFFGHFCSLSKGFTGQGSILLSLMK
jgi:hypothetical protein